MFDHRSLLLGGIWWKSRKKKQVNYYGKGTSINGPYYRTGPITQKPPKNQKWTMSTCLFTLAARSVQWKKYPFWIQQVLLDNTSDTSVRLQVVLDSKFSPVFRHSNLDESQGQGAWHAFLSSCNGQELRGCSSLMLASKHQISRYSQCISLTGKRKQTEIPIKS